MKLIKTVKGNKVMQATERDLKSNFRTEVSQDYHVETYYVYNKDGGLEFDGIDNLDEAITQAENL